MSVELFKSMVYKDNKVYTRQCSNNVYPKDYYTEENKSLTNLFNKLGKEDYEKFFILDGIIYGDIRILNNCNSVLAKIKQISNNLWDDVIFRKMYDKNDELFSLSLSTKIEEDKKLIQEEMIKNKEDMKNYVSSFYDKYNKLYKRREKGR